MIVFLSTVGLSAFLLFLVQPLIARQILPWFGGSAAVWTTCMVFFQLVLLAGYFYADVVVRRLDARRQAIVHAVLLVASLALLPITASEAFKPVDASNPIGRILLLLAVTIGLPYLMLSTTGPLVQAWFARRYAGTPTLGSVWRLYALSNVASMAALLVYPPLIEPATTTRMQSLGWSAGYVLFVLLALASAWLATRGPAGAAVHAAHATGEAGAAAAPHAAMDGEAGPAEQGLWLLLAALGSVLLLTVTTHITQNVASVPFLWVLPLAIYLLSFILTFDGRGWYWRRTYHVLAALLALAMLAGLVYRPRSEWEFGQPPHRMLQEGLLPLTEAVTLYAVGLFVLCMFCHGELVRRKPAPRQLTRFYLMVALGGAVGGLLVGIVAPLTLRWYWELPAALLLAGALVVVLGSRVVRIFAVLALVGGALIVWRHQELVNETTIEMSRNFYGTLRVKATGPEGQEDARLRMVHGVITHGEQLRDPAKRREATTYYGPNSGVVVALQGLRLLSPGKPQRVGLVGLGTGTLATWGREGDSYRFYELNPAVLDLAQRHFTFLKDSPAKVETALGDARLVLEREPPQNFDLLAVDAFSSDAIPVHLLTREAMAVYRRHLAQGGVVALHVTNRYLDLLPVARQLADESDMAPWLVPDAGVGLHYYTSDWVLITANRPLIEWLHEHKKGGLAEGPPLRRPWTDDHSSLFEVLK